MASARTELGDFLRSRRAQLDPRELGLNSLRRRRTPGLRREEVAELAGIGTDWYTRLEQGRAVRPSVSTIDAIARAMRLTGAECDHLRRLVRLDQRTAFTPEVVPSTLVRLVESMPFPAYVTGQRWDVLAWNAAAADLLIDFAGMPAPERNVLIYMLTERGARALFGEAWEGLARRMLAQFRSDYADWAGDAAFEELVALLGARSAAFRSWWSTHEVRGLAAGEKLLHHPRHGDLLAEYVTLQSNDDKRLKLVMYRIEQRSTGVS